MAVELDHTIVAARDAEAGARWFAEMLGLPEPQPVGRFWQVGTENGVALDFATAADPEAIPRLHLAFRISEADFDAIHGRIVERGVPFWGGPRRRDPGEINRRQGGRGAYFDDPDGHSLEILTR